MKLRMKILIPIITILILSITSLGVFGFIKVKDIAIKMLNNELVNALRTVEGTMKERLDIMDITKESLNNKNIFLAKSVAEIIASDNNMLTTKNMIQLAKELGVDEIHVTDKDGKLAYGTSEEFFGFDFHSDEQTKPFLKILEDENFTMAQEPTKRGTDGKLFQYIGVSRIDQPGIVQIGVRPEVIEELMSKMDLQALVERINIGEDGSVFILDKNGIEIANPIKKYIGIDVGKYDWGKEIMRKGEGSIRYELDGMDKHIQFKRVNDYIIVATIPASVYLIHINELKSNMIIILITSIVLAVLLISVFTNKNVIKPLKELVAAMEGAGNGDFRVTLSVKSKDEIGLLSSSFNKMTENIKKLVKDVQEIAINSENTSQIIAATAEEMGISSTDVARSIQEIAAGATSQAIEAGEGLNVINILAEKIVAISDKSQITVSNATNMKDKNEFGIKTVAALKDKFGENNKATMEVAEKIQELSSKSQSIGNIINAINGIAEQTNLLALNAAIEAARAGEAGKGFAVVAEEVRKLAEESSVATNEIQKIIEAISQVIINTEKTMDHASQLVEEVDSSLEDTSEAFSEIKISAHEVLNNIELLSNDVDEINTSKDKVIMSIENISAITEESAAATQQVSAAAEEQTASIEETVSGIQELDSMLKTLSESVKVFKV
ncbi:methyl-accepting chemotaxis protein [Marinisporobacter balticus]|uniref:Methyl-accepting chemotaxis protein n=1 Tax=Marinisporobacter balticus TaxID=2018667 RepID=A0A4R2KJ93_9FIRM|nr:methyl-accepting chemotaxis protein [Marinisporobacter balticus]TCO70646.1 methyl-accepting chemotaxis protein [Marinisporobacter balticus]